MNEREFLFMSKKTFALVNGIIGGLVTVAIAIVTYTQPPYAVAIVGALGIVATATADIMALFVKS